MRTAKAGGKCSECGHKSRDGLFWDSRQHMLDFGDGPLMETWDDVPELCDDCERKRTTAQPGREAKA